MAIDYGKIIEELNDDKVKALLDKLEVPWTDKGDYLLCRTACHHADCGEASDKLYYYKNSKLFVCYTECGDMSIFKFLKNYYEARDYEYDWYQDIYKLVLGCSDYKGISGFEAYKPYQVNKGMKKIPVLPEFDPTVLETFVKTYPPEWLNDGITPAAMDKFNIRYSISQNKIIIPHYDIKGRLVGIRGRALNPSEIELFGKYAPVQIENKLYNHPLSCNLYGLRENLKNIRRIGICYICESERSLLSIFPCH